MARPTQCNNSPGAQCSNESGSNSNPVDSCDCTSYCYFSLAVILFSVGTIITILALNSDSSFSNLGHMWLVGPIFISSGLMVAIKTIIYLRKKTMITFIERQRSILRDLNCDSWDDTMPRNVSNLTFPPSYDAVVANTTSQSNSNTWLLHPECRREPPSYIRDPDYQDPLTYRDQECQDPPPSYEEAMLLYNPAHGSGGLIGQSDHIQEPSTESSESHLNNQNSQHDSKDVP